MTKDILLKKIKMPKDYKLKEIASKDSFGLLIFERKQAKRRY